MSSSPTEVTMPQMGVSVAEGTVVAWHKQVGDLVALDETICEISTDKIDTDVPSPAAGRLVRVLVPEGQTVVVGTVLAEIDTSARETVDSGGDAGGPTAAAACAPASAPDSASASRGMAAAGALAAATSPSAKAVLAAHDRPRGMTASTPAAPGEPTPEGGHLAISSAAAQGVPAAPGGMAPVAPGQGGATADAAEHAPDPEPAAGYSPVVRRIAAEHGIDLAQVVGSGRDGRVSKQDVLNHLAARAGDGAAGGGGRSASVTREPLSRMRRAIGEHMVRSLRTAAHCTTVIEVDMARVEAARAVAGLSPLPYVARCLVESLGAFGRLNATLDGDTLTRYADVDLGVAVSLGDEGLIVPVVRRAQALSVEELAAAIRDLAARARAGQLTPDDVRGATFTITNPGRWGTIGATPIINQPQVAILDLEAIVRRPIVVGDGIAIRPMCNLCLSWDHRALDGVLAAEFLADLRARIERFAG